MFCSKCGNKLNEEEKFCSKCGNEVNAVKTQNNNSMAQSSSHATTGLILGICSIIAWIIPLVGYPVTITGIVFSSKGLGAKNNGKAICGLVLSIIFLIFTLINSIVGAIIGVGMASY